MRDRRFEPRHPADEQIELTWSEGSGCGTLRDLSRSGARIELRHAIRVETPVRVSVGGFEAGGRITSCARLGGGYTLGVEFDPEFQGVLKRKR